MIAVIQRVSGAGVSIGGQLHASIEQGLLVLLGICDEDTAVDVEWLAAKITQMRIFSDEAGKMNLSALDLNADYLVISQFTLHASTKKGNRPSFIKAARPEVAIPLYEQFLDKMEHLSDKQIASGIFGADMKVSLVNDGPVTIILDSQDRK